jgi:hypothetical protein
MNGLSDRWEHLLRNHSARWCGNPLEPSTTQRRYFASHSGQLRCSLMSANAHGEQNSALLLIDAVATAALPSLPNRNEGRHRIAVQQSSDSFL